MRKTVSRRIAAAVVAITAASLVAARARADSDVTADFAVAEGFPLLKDKFNLYNTAIPTTADFERDVGLLSELNVESMRIEHNWGFGQTLSGSVGGTPQDLQFDWQQADRWQRLVNTRGLLFHWGYDYSPVGNSAAPPPLDVWAHVLRTAAAHHRSLGLPVVYHEVWNEPDNPPVFFSGTQRQYFDLYRAGARAIRSADPDAKVGGPATAFPGWTDAFVEWVRAQDLPLDFFSIHRYGAPGLDHPLGAARALSRWPRFHTTEILLDEYHTYFGWKRGGPQDTYVGATELLHDFLTFLEHPEITGVNWAQFQDPGDFGDQFLGLVTLDGRRKASFNAFQIYGRMPPERKKASVRGARPPVEAAASGDSHRASLLVLNRSGAAQKVSVTLRNVPFARGTVRLYAIDKTHNSVLDGANEKLTPSREWRGVSTADWKWSGEMADKTTLYIEAEDGSGASDSPPNAVAKVVRVNRYYPARGTRSFSDFDARTWIVRQGMNGERIADQQVGVTADALPHVLDLRGTLDGRLARQDVNSLLGVRVDYDTARGYRKGVLFHGPWGGVDLYDPRRSAPPAFGTRRPADQVVRVPDLARFLVRPADHAPADWNGRVAITFLLRNAGPTARVRWTVRGRSNRVFATNAGSPQAAGAFTRDSGFRGGNRFGVSDPIHTGGVIDPAPAAVYQSERSTRAFWHTTSGLKPDHVYKLRLHWAEFFWKEPGRRLFNVAINGRTMLEHFDIFAAAGGDHRAAVREFFVAANARGNIHLHFTPVRDNTKISGVEVLDTLSRP